MLFGRGGWLLVVVEHDINPICEAGVSGLKASQVYVDSVSEGGGIGFRHLTMCIHKSGAT